MSECKHECKQDNICLDCGCNVGRSGVVFRDGDHFSILDYENEPKDITMTLQEMQEIARSCDDR